MFPVELTRRTFQASNGEYGWSREDARLAISSLVQQQYAILGGEAWWVRDGMRHWIGLIPQRHGPDAVYSWETKREAGEAWATFVGRCAEESLKAINRWPGADDLPDGLSGRILYNLTWIGEAKFRDGGVMPGESLHLARSRISSSSTTAYMTVGVIGYTAFRTGAAFLAVRQTDSAILAGLLLGLLASAWVVSLLVVAVKRRHRTKWQTSFDFTFTIGIGYVLTVIATTPVRVQVYPEQTLSATLPLLAVATLVAMIIILPVAGTIITFFRRKDPVVAVAPPA